MMNREARCQCGQLRVRARGEPAFPSPALSVYEARMHAWVGIAAEVEHHD